MALLGCFGLVGLGGGGGKNLLRQQRSHKAVGEWS